MPADLIGAVLDGVTLTDDDRRKLAWAAQYLDADIQQWIASLVNRARVAEFDHWQDKVVAAFGPVFTTLERADTAAKWHGLRDPLHGQVTHAHNKLLGLEDADGNLTAYVTEQAPRIAAETPH